MKKIFKKVGLLACILLCGVMNVNATSSNSIDTTTCSTVYTNYYFFLDALGAGTTDTNISFNHTTMAVYNNNYYTTMFNSNNVGYGQVNLTKSTSTSSNGISSMSMTDYYDSYLKASANGGSYKNGTKNYIVSHDWLKYENGSWLDGGTVNDTVSMKNQTVSQLISATLNANSTITRVSAVNYSNANPFELRIDRSYYGSLTGSPVSVNGNKWYIHPAVYYVQYCSPKTVSVSKYTINYHGNASSVSNVPDSQTADSDDCLSISKIVPVRDGYTFMGWSTSSSASSASSAYAAGKSYCGENGSLDLYAVWKKNNSYIVEYNPNTTDTVTNLPSNQTKDDNCIKLSNLTPVRNGYTFMGWSTNSNATSGESDYANGNNYCENNDLKLYAIWKKNDANTYNLSYNPNTSETVTNMPSNVTISTDENVTISSQIPVRSGYTFIGWSTDAYATSANYAKGTVYSDRKDLTLYAIWKKNSDSLVDNPKTGIISYIAPVSGLIAASGAGLGILKKKKSFRQF